jgi:hypothetical protein
MVKVGFRKARSQRNLKRGRPSIITVKQDSNLATKASEMRDLGLSWSQIASRLNIGRTTARRLVNLCQNDEKDWLEKGPNRFVPKFLIDDGRKKGDQLPNSSYDDEILARLPKTYQILAKLLEKAREMQE